MPTSPVALSSYKRLVADIASLYEGARKALVTAYWEIGKRIVLVEQQGAIKAAYGAGLLQKLSEDLTRQLGSGFSERSLERMRAFYLHHPKSSPATKLTWAHHIELLSIHDKKKRFALEKRAEQGELDRDGLRALVRHELVREQVAENLSGNGERETDPPELLPVPALGPFFTYKIIKPEIIHSKSSELLIDLGFATVLELNKISDHKYKPDDIVTSSKDAKGHYSLKIPSPIPLPRGEDKGERASGALHHPPSDSQFLYTYKAYVERVVDGDTLKVEIDLGFNTRIRQYLRLKGIDCPEMDSSEGKRAKKFVETTLEGVEYLTIKTTRSDKYDRYLADVFIDSRLKAADNSQSTMSFPNASIGNPVYLNNLLLEKGHAVRVRE